ncbi:MAG: TMEM175 family protein [Pseudomonadota bacterium]
MWTDDRLAALPVVGGFRQRGMEMTRLETFTDAAFAFALTLLVISFDNIPQSFTELVEALKNIPAFAVSFALISLFWFAHHKWSRRFGLDDTLTVVISLSFVFVTLIYVFPLRLVASALLAWLTDDWISFEMTGAGQSPEGIVGFIFVIYGAGFFAMSGLIALLYAHALRVAALNLNREERFIGHAEMQTWLIMAASGLLSVVIAQFGPASWRIWAGFAYAPLAVVMPVFGILKSRQWARISGAA